MCLGNLTSSVVVSFGRYSISIGYDTYIHAYVTCLHHVSAIKKKLGAIWFTLLTCLLKVFLILRNAHTVWCCCASAFVGLLIILDVASSLGGRIQRILEMGAHKWRPCFRSKEKHPQMRPFPINKAKQSSRWKYSWLTNNMFLSPQLPLSIQAQKAARSEMPESSFTVTYRRPL